MLNVLHRLLQLALDHNASDLHMKAYAPPMLRINGLARWVEVDPYDNDQGIELLRSIVPPHMAGEDLRQDLVQGIDFSYDFAGRARFRCNAHLHLGNVALTLRTIRLEIPSFDELNLPKVMEDIASAQRGLTIVTGTTGSGKSSTLAAVIDLINTKYPQKIICVEDPVEFLHRDKQSFVVQVEIGSDSPNFEQALRQALRQDPDVILVGELRDVETLRMALRAADTGHQVFSTLHSSTAAQSIERIIAMFPQNEHQLLLAQLAGSLEAIVSQRLVRTVEEGRRPAVEILRGGPVVEKYILENRVDALEEFIEGGDAGMQSFDQHLLEMYHAKIISGTEALHRASNPERVSMGMRGIIRTTSGITG